MALYSTPLRRHRVICERLLVDEWNQVAVSGSSVIVLSVHFVCDSAVSARGIRCYLFGSSRIQESTSE